MSIYKFPFVNNDLVQIEIYAKTCRLYLEHNSLIMINKQTQNSTLLAAGEQGFRVHYMTGSELSISFKMKL